MNQENKERLRLEIAKVMPKAWKWTLAVRHHSTLVLTVRQADVDLIDKNLALKSRNDDSKYRSLNEYNLQGEYSGKLLKIFEGIKGAMNVGNHDNSDVQTDYFDVGWYIDINVGESRSPFRYVPAKKPDNRIHELMFEIGKNATHPAGMPEGLDEAGQIAWMKNRIAELEAK